MTSPTRFTRPLSIGANCILLAMLLPSGVAAQTPSYAVQWPVTITFQRPSLNLTANGSINAAKSSNTESGTNISSSNSYSISSSTNGYIYHPALARYSLSIAPVFRESNADWNADVERKSQSSSITYTLGTTLLARKPYALTLSANRTEAEQGSFLQPDIFSVSEKRSARFNISNRWLPIRVNFDNRSILREADDWDSSSNSDSLSLSGTNRSERQTTSIKYVRRQGDSARNGFSSTTELQSVVARRSQQLGFGRPAIFVFSSTEADVNGAKRKSSNLSSSFSMDLPKNFSAGLSLNGSQSQSESTTNRAKSYGASLNHQLYENLSTTLATGAGSSGVDYDQKQQFDSVSVAYNRRVPWGHLALSQGMTRQTSTNSLFSGFTDVFDEPHVFETNSAIIILDQPNVDAESITITDDNGLTVYEPGFDYSVEVVDGAIIISRSPLGSIIENQTVLLSYRYLQDRPSTRNSATHNTSASTTIGQHLSIFASASNQSTDVVSGFEPNYLLDRSTRNYGASLQLGRSTTQLRLNEVESGAYSAKSWDLSSQYNFLWRNRQRVGLAAGYSESEIGESGQKYRSLSADADTSFQMKNGRSLGVSAKYYRTRSNRSDLQGLAISASYSFNIGAWRTSLFYNLYGRENVIAESNSVSQRLRFSVRRRFF